VIQGIVRHQEQLQVGEVNQKLSQERDKTGGVFPRSGDIGDKAAGPSAAAEWQWPFAGLRDARIT